MDHSADLFQGELHKKVCGVIASACVPDPMERCIYENLLFLKSTEARGATAAISQLLAGGGATERLELTAILQPAVPAELHAGIGWLPTVPTRLVDPGVVRTFAVKALVHWVFRCFRRKLRPGAMLRAWVEVSLKMYGQEMDRSAPDIRVYPFPISLMRQVRFLASLRGRRLTWSFEGVPYRLADFIRALRGRLTDRGLAQAEAFGYLAHADELVRAGITTLYTSDEFEVGAVVMHQRLGGSGVRSVNTAHGVGGYCPRIAYTEFRVISRSQAAFYQRDNPAIRYTLRANANRALVRLPPVPAGQTGRSVVYIHQNWEELGFTFEAGIQQRICSALTEVAKIPGIRISLKVHPNSSKKTLAALRRDWPGAILRDFADLPAIKPIFIIMNSTTYFELGEAGPVLACKDHTLAPELYFGEGLDAFTLDALRSRIAELMDDEAWAGALARQKLQRAAELCL
ncbi:hypothetical protein Verru16b_02060 [Lacunisphaera limnophila]|uniref:Uncharacterized protein n=2 Tax=Lacunisphaera limnophila TaxID=1838286 RepID=A0A1D8AVT6_9BACT|nr:hypothetical protein Verru16b_02060 [Lacunisphaera limnophila]